MLEFCVIFCLASLGSLVCISTEMAQRAVARKSLAEAVANGPGRVRGASAGDPHADPVFSFGLIVACYGAFALGVVCELPGSRALERAGLAFAWLCVGGLISKIASTGSNAAPCASDGDAGLAQPKPVSLRLAVALTVTLNVTLALLCSGQGLVEVVPPKPAGAAYAEVLEPIIVVAARKHDTEGLSESL